MLLSLSKQQTKKAREEMQIIKQKLRADLKFNMIVHIWLFQLQELAGN